jgi:tRNA(fMet)-specific endonuclease VapC
MRGWLSFIAKATKPNLQVNGYFRLHSLLDDFNTRPVLDFDALAANQFERLIRLKIRIGTMDLKIAAICIRHDALLLSENLTHFRKVPHLRVDDWSV